MSNIEDSVSRVLYVASRVEKMLHDDGPWTITWGPHEVPAIRTITADCVSFTASIPETCWIVRPHGSVDVRCDGEVVAFQHIADPGDAPFVVKVECMTRDHHVRV